MICRLPHAKCKCWINFIYDRIRYSPSKVISSRNTSITVAEEAPADTPETIKKLNWEISVILHDYHAFWSPL